NGGMVVSDPIRDREFKRARKQISDGIHGSAIGAALVVAAAVPYFLIERSSWLYTVTLVLALAGIVKLFKSVGSIIDAKVGPKLLDPSLQTRATGNLNGAGLPANVRPSQRLPELDKVAAGPVSHTRPVSPEEASNAAHLPANLPASSPPRIGTGRINREHSSPLGKLDKDDDLMSRLRN
ncbi:MAG TPA: hypothetical protein VIG62_09775, partial [Blastocatellia bacterium]